MSFGTNRRQARKRYRSAVNFRQEVRKGNSPNVMKVHDRRWMIVVAVIVILAALHFLHVIL